MVVRSIVPGTLSPSTRSFSRFSGQRSCSIESWKERIRASTEGDGSKRPRLLLSRKGAVDHTLMSEGTRVYPRPPAGISYSHALPVTGWWTLIFPTDGRSLYDCEEKLSQMSPRSAFVASGLHALVSRRVTGTRSSVER